MNCSGMKTAVILIGLLIVCLAEKRCFDTDEGLKDREGDGCDWYAIEENAE